MENEISKEQQVNQEIDNIMAGATVNGSTASATSEQTPGGVPEGQPEETAQAGTEGQADGVATPAETDKPVENQPPIEQPSTDFAKILEEHSGGVVKSPEELQALVSKLSELETKTKNLESEKDTIFANDYVKLLNDLHKQGKTSEQIEEFQKLHKLGDLSNLDAKEVLVQNLIDQGAARAVAEKIVEGDYGLDQISLDESSLTDEELQQNKEKIELIKSRMELAAKPIRADFQKRIDEFSKPVDATQEALNKVAAEKAYKQKLEPFADTLVQKFPSKLEIQGLSFDVPAEFKDSVRSFALDYFLNTEVNDKNVQDFEAIQKAIFVSQNIEAISTALVNKGKEIGKQETEAKFVNNQGLNRQGAVHSEGNENITDTDIYNNAMSMAD